MADPVSLVVSITTLLKLTAKLTFCIDKIHDQVKSRPKILEWLAKDLEVFQALLSQLRELPGAREDRICGAAAPDHQPDQAQLLPLQDVLNACLELLNSLHAAFDKLRKAFTEPSFMAYRKVLGQWRWRSSLDEISTMRKQLENYKTSIIIMLQLKDQHFTKLASSSGDTADSEITCNVADETSSSRLTTTRRSKDGTGRARSQRREPHSQAQRSAASSSKAIENEGQDKYDPALYGSFQDWLEAFTISEEAPACPSEPLELPQSLCENALKSESSKKVSVCVYGLLQETEHGEEEGGLKLDLNLSDYLVTMIQDLKEPGDDDICGLEMEGQYIPLFRRYDDWIPVEVVETESKHSLATGLAINLDMPVEQFYDCCIRGWKYGTPCNEVSFTQQADSIIVSDGSPTPIRITLERTLRLPEDDKSYNCPLPLGPIPFLRSSQPDTEKPVPEVQICLYQREALLLKFCRASRPLRAPTEDLSDSKDEMFAVGVLGGSSTSSDTPSEETMKHIQQTSVVVPKQNLLPGWPSGTGYSQQFVAMPLGDNYSTEYQTSQTEQYGGMQLMITPKFLEIGWFRKEDGYLIQRSTSAREGGFRPGDTLFVRGPSSPDWSMSSYRTLELTREYWRTITDDENKPDQFRPLRAWELKCILARTGINSKHSEKLVVLNVVRCITVRVRIDQYGQSVTTVRCSPFISFNELTKLVSKRQGILLPGYEFYREDGTIVTSPWTNTLRSSDIKYGDLLTIQVMERFNMIPLSAYPAGPRRFDMGIGPGKIIYQAHSVIENCWRWNWKQSKMIHIRILNAVAFQSFSDGVLPPDPISFKDYVDAGLPFLQFLPPASTAEEGEEGIIPKFKSVGQVDAARGVTMDVHLRRGKIIGCIVCANNLADSILMPCKHVLCSDCIKTYMGSYTLTQRRTCSVCKGIVDKVIRFSGSSEIPKAAKSGARFEKQTGRASETLLWPRSKASYHI
ncbi:hypothetical protein HD806DRAFT_78228 [Xylariaceae sp. AK1471]|nr:hypothetical protein HD806DRAFT_78228 [Xylariaceae sp. AK1471]